MAIYIPNYIKQHLDYKSNERVTHEDYNNILNLLVTASDYNTDTLNAIVNNVGTKLVINAVNADRADEADVAHDSELLSGASLSRRVSATLSNDDNKIPSSKQVKEYIDTIQDTNVTAFNDVNTRIDNTIVKNTEQDSRLANIDLINNQYGNLITLLTNRVGVLETGVTAIRNTDIAQDATLASHNQRITNLELGEVPPDVLNTLMTKGGYALPTGLDEFNNPTYSSDTVKKAESASKLTVDGANIEAAAFALNADVESLASITFAARGAIPDPVSTVYSVGELKQLKHGSYEVNTTNSTALNTGGISGTLRLYPCSNGLSLEYEIQTGADRGMFYTVFIPQSTPDATGMDSITWYDLNTRLESIENNVTSLTSNKLVVSNLIAGTDISLSKSDNNTTFNYTGPKVVISTTQPAADPNRKTLWIAL